MKHKHCNCHPYYKTPKGKKVWDRIFKIREKTLAEDKKKKEEEEFYITNTVNVSCVKPLELPEDIIIKEEDNE